MSYESQRIGYEAELRARNLAQDAGFEVYTNPVDDYSNKTDLWIEGRPVQVSVKEKSRRQRDTLQARGIFTLIAGKQLEDADVLKQIYTIVAAGE